MEDSKLSTSWSTPEVGYFMPRAFFSVDDKELRHMETGKDLITRFYNVHAFVAHLRGLLIFKQEAVIRANVHACLRDDALDWYNTELTDAERMQLSVLPVEKGWFNMLLQRFTPPHEMSLFRMDNTKFEIDFLHDEIQEVSACELARNIVRHARALGSNSPKKQMMCVWDRLHTVEGFSHRISKPTSTTSMSAFMREIDSADQARESLSGFDDREFRNWWCEKMVKKFAAGEEMNAEMKRFLESLYR